MWHLDLEEREDSVIFWADGSVPRERGDRDCVRVEDGEIVRVEPVEDEGALEPWREPAAHEGDEGGGLQGVQQLCPRVETVHCQVRSVPYFGHRDVESVLDTQVDVVREQLFHALAHHLGQVEGGGEGGEQVLGGEEGQVDDISCHLLKGNFCHQSHALKGTWVQNI